MLQDKIHFLRERVMEMAAIAEDMIGHALEGLIDKKRKLLVDLIEIQEPKVNELENDIDELGIEVIALYEPKASDLRLLLTMMRMNTDLERIADHAQNIAESALYLIGRPPVKPFIDLPRLAEEVKFMLRQSIDAFSARDSAAAKRTLLRDDTVDALRDQIFRELITIMTSEPASIERSLHLMRITQNLERAADLSTNICENVIYMVEGKTVKHHFGQEENHG